MRRHLVLLALWGGMAMPAVASTPLEQVAEPSAPFHQERFLLGYEIYLASGNQAAAYRVAERAVREQPRDVEWRRRLATVAQWLGKPEVALANWLAIARQTGDVQAWREVGKLAPALADSEALLAWWQQEVRRRPRDEKALNELVKAYEQVGQPEQALATLRRLPRHRRVLEAEASLAERSGQDEAAIATLLELNRRFGPGEEWVMRAAGLHLQRGQLAQADALLGKAAPTMPATAERFWQLRAEVARLSGNPVAAVQAYRRLEATGKVSGTDLYSQAELLEQKDPLAAAQFYVRAWQQDHQPEAAVAALYQWSKVQAWVPAEGFLATLSAAELARLEQHAGFLEQRAGLQVARGRLDEAGRDLAAALALAPRNIWLRQTWMGWMVTHGAPDRLRRMLQEQRGQAARLPELWPLWAAGWNRLDAPHQALPWLQQYFFLKRDDLSALALADTLRAAGQEAQARQLEERVWARRAGPGQRTPELQREYADALFRLRLAQLSVDARRHALRGLIQREQDKAGQVRDVVRDLVLAEAWAGEAADMRPPQTGEALPTGQPLPRWSQLGTALLLDDSETLGRLLEQPDLLPANDRVAAAIRLGRTEEATLLAAEGADARPFDDVSHQYYQERLWRDGNRASIALRNEDFSSLERDVLVLELQHGLSEHLRLHLAHEAATLDSDPAQVRLPEDRHDWSLAGLVWQGEQLRAEVAMTRLDGIDTETGGTAGVLWSRPPFQFNLEAGLRQPATESAGLRVGGYRDHVLVGGNWQLAPRHNLQLQAEHARYGAQGGGDLGESDTFTLGWRYQLDAGLSLNARVVQLQSSSEQALPGQLLPVLPVGAAANPVLFVPSEYWLGGLGLAWGESAEYGYQRRWRGFGSAGLTYDDIVDVGYEARLGVLGPVLGRDRLRLYASGSDGAQANAEPNLTLNLDYLFFY